MTSFAQSVGRNRFIAPLRGDLDDRSVEADQTAQCATLIAPYELRAIILGLFNLEGIMKIVIAAAVTFAFTGAAFAQQVMSNEPPPGQLAAGQVVYVSCGPGMARKIAGGDNMRGGTGGPRKHGPCVKMK